MKLNNILNKLITISNKLGSYVGKSFNRCENCGRAVVRLEDKLIEMERHGEGRYAVAYPTGKHSCIYCLKESK